jgi:hypothetical protein
MTKEAIITRLNSMQDYYNDRREPYYVGFDAADNEALDMAIKALEQQPCWDAISRAEAIRQFIRWASDTDDTHAEVVDFSDILEYLPYKICPNCGADMRGEDDDT